MAADESALGLLETQGLVAAIEAADAMLKTAAVRLVSIEQTIPALITIYVVGDTASVQASVDAGRYAAERIGKVISAHVIPRADDEVWRMIGVGSRTPKLGEAPKSSQPPIRSTEKASRQARDRDEGGSGGTDYDAMTVRELRAIAREIPDFPIQGRAVASARKDDLVEHLKRYR